MSKSIQQRVDILLKEGVDNPKKWMKVHGYQEPMGSVDSWEDEWQRLRLHHLDETGFLFEVIQELVSRVK